MLALLLLLLTLLLQLVGCLLLGKTLTVCHLAPQVLQDKKGSASQGWGKLGNEGPGAECTIHPICKGQLHVQR